MGQRLQPAFWGGLFIGVLSALPFVGALNSCCCLWVIAGGVLTSYLLQERAAMPITAGDGAVAGLLAGAIGAVLASVLGLVLTALRGGGPRESLERMLADDGLPAEVGRIFEQLRGVPELVWFLALLVLSLILFPVFGMLGGLLGVAIFKKNPPPPPPVTVEVLPPLP